MGWFGGAEHGQRPPHGRRRRHFAAGRRHRGARLIKNLTVRRARKANKHELVAGARRLAALRLLVTEGRFAEHVKVPCKVLDAVSEAEISLAENTQREAMHTIDEILAHRRPRA
nr:ParB N-terminal domain-containing protein [Rhizobium laguerreae]